MQAVALINFAESQACVSSAWGDADAELVAEAKKAHLSLMLLRQHACYPSFTCWVVLCEE